MGKLLSGKRDQGDRDCVHGRDLIAGSNTLCECFNNVDVSVPLWLTESRDFVSKSLLPLIPTLNFRIYLLQSLCAFIFID